MGLDGVIRKWLKEVLPDAFLKKLPHEKKGVRMCDFLTRIHKLRGRAGREQMTGHELYLSMVSPIRKYLNQADAQVYVMCCDISEYVPLRKGTEQKKRTKQSAKAGKTAYEGGYELTDFGLRNSETGQTEPIVIERLAATRSLRRAAMNHFVSNLRHEQFPTDKSVIIDFDGRGPIAYTNGKFTAHPRLRHRLGEYDQQCMLWARRFAGYDIVFETTDQDLMPIWVQFCETVGQDAMFPDGEGSYTWKYAKDGIVDLWTLGMGILGLMPARVFIVLCCAMGTDYVEKKHFSPGVGWDITRKLVLDSADSLAAIRIDWKRMILAGEQVWSHKLCVGIFDSDKESKTPTGSGGVALTLGRSDTRKDMAPLLALRQKFKNVPGARGASKPTLQEEDDVCIAILWNMMYWSMKWTAVR